MNKIVIYVEGGAIQSIYGEDVEVYIADYDIDGYNPHVLVDVEGFDALVYRLGLEKKNDFYKRVIKAWKTKYELPCG